MEQEHTCKATLYILNPISTIKKEQRTEIMRRPLNDNIIATGHVFIGITDSNGAERKYGLGARAYFPVPIQTKYVPKGRIYFKPLSDIEYIKGTDGLVVNEIGEHFDFSQGFVGKDWKNNSSPYDMKIEYSITQSQYETIKDFLENSQKNPPQYSLTHNCVDFAYEALKQGGIRPPVQLPLISMPLMLVLDVRKDKLKNALFSKEKVSALKKVYDTKDILNEGRSR